MEPLFLTPGAVLGSFLLLPGLFFIYLAVKSDRLFGEAPPRGSVGKIDGAIYAVLFILTGLYIILNFN